MSTDPEPHVKRLYIRGVMAHRIHGSVCMFVCFGVTIWDDFGIAEKRKGRMMLQWKLLLEQFSCAAVENENNLSVSCKKSEHLLTAVL